MYDLIQLHEFQFISYGHMHMPIVWTWIMNNANEGINFNQLSKLCMSYQKNDLGIIDAFDIFINDL